MRFKASMTTAFALLACQLLTVAALAQRQPSKPDVGSKDVQKLINALVLTTDVDLNSVERALAQIRATWARSQQARERLYYKVGMPEDSYIRFKHLENLSVALAEHASEAWQAGNKKRACRALDLSMATILLVATAPAPPAKVRLEGTYYVSGDMTAGEPVWALSGALSRLGHKVLECLQSSPPNVKDLLRQVWAAVETASFAIHERGKRLSKLFEQGDGKQYARECAEIRSEVSKWVTKARTDLASACKKL